MIQRLLGLFKRDFLILRAKACQDVRNATLRRCARRTVQRVSGGAPEKRARRVRHSVGETPYQPLELTIEQVMGRIPETIRDLART